MSSSCMIISGYSGQPTPQNSISYLSLLLSVKAGTQFVLVYVCVCVCVCVCPQNSGRNVRQSYCGKETHTLLSWHSKKQPNFYIQYSDQWQATSGPRVFSDTLNLGSSIKMEDNLGVFTRTAKFSKFYVCGSVHHSVIHIETRCHSVSKFISYLYEAQHVSGDTPPIIRSLKLH